MGDLSAIGYKPGRSMLHRLDPRTKQLLLIGLSAVSLQGDLTFLTLTSLLLIFFLYAANLRMGRVLFEIRYFLLFLVFVFAVRTIAFSDRWIPTILSGRELAAALIVCWRLLLVVLMGLLLMATTRISDIRAALIWLLKPLPLVDENAAATMVGLVVRFLPLILFQAAEIGEAMRARGIQQRKNPLTRFVKFTTALFRRVFLRADELADTMQARCYSTHRRIPELVFARRDGLAALIGILLGLTVLLP
jgi:energy-coupling factor transporter transmembrane protein EcfT